MKLYWHIPPFFLLRGQGAVTRKLNQFKTILPKRTKFCQTSLTREKWKNSCKFVQETVKIIVSLPICKTFHDSQGFRGKCPQRKQCREDKCTGRKRTPFYQQNSNIQVYLGIMFFRLYQHAKYYSCGFFFISIIIIIII